MSCTEKQKAAARRYRQRHLADVREKDRIRQRENAERIAERARKRYKADPTVKLEYVRKWRKDNPEKDRQIQLRWRVANRDKDRLKSHKRRAVMRVGRVSDDIISQLLNMQNGLCSNELCRDDLILEGYHLDHIMPLALGGKHEDTNLQLLCAVCNLSKGARHPNEWRGEIPLV